MRCELDRDAQVILDVIAASGEPHLSTLSVAAARARMRSVLVTRGKQIALRSVEDVSVPTPSGPLRVRLYRPTDGCLPVALFLHGGGWTVNDVDTHDEVCRRLARRSGWLLASLDYRKAPEHRHPASLEDAYLTYRWLLDRAAAIGCDPARRAVVGESSGGTIAANLTVLLRDLGAPMPTYQVLAYPVTDAFDRWPSYSERGTGYILDRPLMEWYFGHCLPPGAPPDDRYCIPLATEDLSRLPPTLIVTAEFDPLRDEGIAYAERLAEAGVAVEHVHAADQMHGFLLLGRVVPGASALIDLTADSLARAAARIEGRQLA
ncbi:MAG: acetyl esterase [Solirubrobacteraceae bacterium]|jgi:acetyl esterase|nr:acetyl esterase [Solirubrobacteraceae bacterium]